MPQDNERIAVVEKAIEGIEKGVSRLEQKLDSLLDNIEKKFVPRHEYDSHKEHFHSEITDLKDEIKAMKERSNKVVGWTITAMVTIGAAIIESVHLFK
jgi:peptidoglycan hydrolase CwlO-like protein